MEISKAARGQLVRLVILTAAGLTLTAFVRLPTWRLPLIVLDSPLTLELTGVWVVAGTLGVLVCAGTDVLVRLDPKWAAAPLAETAPFWILPGLIAVVATLLTAKLVPGTALWWLTLGGVALGIGGVGWMLLARLEGTSPRSTWVDFLLTVASYGLALVVFTAVYAARVRTALSGSAIGIAATLLAVWLFSDAEPLGRRTIAFSGVVGLAMLVATWVLNHRSLPAVVGGALLLLPFYVLTSLMRAHQQDRLTWHTLVELAAVAAAVLLLIIGLTPR